MATSSPQKAGLCLAGEVYGSGGSRGGGGAGGPPPLLGHDVGFLTLGPKLDPPLFLLVDLRCSGGSCG